MSLNSAVQKGESRRILPHLLVQGNGQQVMAHRGERVGHRQDPRAAVLSQGTDRLRPGFVECTRKRSLVRCREAPT